MAETGMPSTQAKRSADNIASFGMGALLLFAVSGGLFLNEQIVGSAIVLLAALGASYATFRGSFGAACPICGQLVDELSEGNPKRCPNCFCYSVLIGGRFVQLDPGAAGYGPFTIPLPRNFQMPKVCCGCGAPATGNKRISQTVNLANVATLPPPSTLRAYNFDVPVCSAHDPVVILRAEGTKNSIGLRRIGIFDSKVTPSNPGLFAVMQVPSYRFYWEFIHFNGMTNV